MRLKAIQFSALLFTALAMVPLLAHLVRKPSRDEPANRSTTDRIAR